MGVYCFMKPSKVFHFFLPLLLLSQVSGAHAFWKSKAKQTEKQQSFYQTLNERVTIHKRFKSSKNTYRTHLDIAVVLDKQDLVIKYDYDELKDIAIKNIEWIYAGKSTKPYKSQNILNKELEQRSDARDPIQAYDRILDSKHMRSKLFYFKLDKVFEKVKKADERKAHKVRIYWANKATITLAVEDIYKPIPKAEPKKKKKTKKKKRKTKKSKKPSQKELEL